MKTKLHSITIALALLALGTFNSLFSTAFAQGTAFTYQGRLNNGTNPVTGSYDMTFALYNASLGGTQIGNTLTNLAVGVTNGLFTTTLDFGNVFTGSPAWAAIGVRTNGAATFTSLTQLQQLTPTPYAITAESAINLAGLSVQFNTNGAPNLIGGSPVNFVSTGVIGATIGGGGGANVPIPGKPFSGHYTNSVTGNFGTVGGGLVNSAGFGATVGGGQDNNATGTYATVGGGLGNVASFIESTVGGGIGNIASGTASGAATVSGGNGNTAAADYSTVGGGYNNEATNIYATVPGGADNQADGQFSFAAGTSAWALHAGSFVWGDPETTVFASTTTNQFNVRASGGIRFVTGGAGMTLDGVPVTTSPSYVSTPGTFNFFAGQNAGNPGVTGAFNVGVGNLALTSLTYGGYNEAIGSGALLANTSGYFNAANGYAAMQYNTNGSYNTASGAQALYSNTSGNNNTASGSGALYANTNGGANTAVGASTLSYNQNGYNNVALGYEALYAEQYSVDNVAVGVADFQVLQNGGQNTAIGTYDFQSLTNGSGNVGLGYYAGNSLINGSDNIYIGNPGLPTDNNVIRIGNGQTQMFLAGVLQGNPGMSALNVDPAGLNTGSVNVNGLTFGTSSGEGICSKRANSTSNPYDLELCTDFAERLKVAQNGNVGIGTDNPVSLLDVAGTVTVNAITITGGSDVAEPFDLSSQNVPKGSVMVIDSQHPGTLKVSRHAYDKCVAGIVSGANGVNPGLTLNQQSLARAGRAVALTGRVYALADASAAPIEPGDLLTTSDVEGRAMKVTDAAKAQGAIIGKAMSALTTGRGYVLVLVTLQ